MALQIEVLNTSGEVVGSRDLDESVWGIEPNIGVMHQALLRQQANARVGTHETKTRAMVRGGGRKPWRQKGTGRARQGSTRSPQWVGGGVVWGPHMRKYNPLGAVGQVCRQPFDGGSGPRWYRAEDEGDEEHSRQAAFGPIGADRSS